MTTNSTPQSGDAAANEGEPRPDGGMPVLERWYVAIRQALLRVFTWLCRPSWWLIRCTVLAVVLSLLITFPRISFFIGNDPQIKNFWPVVEAQKQAPFSPVVQEENDPTDHSGKRAFRLTLPILGRLLHLDWRGLLLLQYALGVLLFYLAGRLTLELFGDRIVAAATVFGLAFTCMGKAALLQLGGMGDGYALAFFAIAAFWHAPPVVFVSIVLACFTDERALLAAPLLGIYWSVRDGSSFTDGARPRWLSSRAVAVYLAVLFSLGARFVLAMYCGLRLPVGSQYGVGLKPFLANLTSIQWLLPRSLAGFWLWVALAAWLLWQRRRWLALLFGGLAILAVTGAAMSAFDLDRGLLYLFPVVLVAWALAAKANLNTADLREIAVFCFLLCLLFPVNSLVGSPTNRYSEGNVMPIEIIRFVHYWRMR